ncbi:hypothetical protein [Streptomyces griseorubiginosus]|uniref:Uncharacterized protein n=2 Tax=Streptomyces TaxID=1883 RepID=A0AAI8L3I8_9ACTN|nr:hypothetical protein [Streptomyces griseorubiginosus]AYC40529.1 hypothetical protein DWG14_04794 [Streptomyces griseorubiginosus]
MTRSKKVLATIALVLGTTAAAASPALADNHATVSPQDNHATIVTPQDNHATIVTPQDNHAT